MGFTEFYWVLPSFTGFYRVFIFYQEIVRLGNARLLYLVSFLFLLPSFYCGSLSGSLPRSCCISFFLFFLFNFYSLTPQKGEMNGRVAWPNNRPRRRLPSSFFFSHFLLFFPSIRTSKIATEMEKKILENFKKKNRRRKRRRNLLHSFVRFYLVFFWFYLVWSSCTEFYWLLPSFTGLPSSFFSLPFS